MQNSHSSQIQKFFDHLKAAYLTVHLCTSGFDHVENQFLSLVVGVGEIKPITAKVDTIIDLG